MQCELDVSQYPTQVNASIHPYPSGWFCVALSRDLRPGQVRPLRYFGRDLVLYRGDGGAAHVLDAYCPHLGAHLGYGGRVHADCIECPFHGWRFDGAGQCASIPYSKKIPRNARLLAWPVSEINGLIMVYYDEQGHAPTWQMPHFPEHDSAEWQPFAGSDRVIDVHPQEMMENIFDLAHFTVIHQFRPTTDTTSTFESDGARLTYSKRHAVRVLPGRLAARLNCSHMQVTLESTFYGLGCLVARTVNVNPRIKLRSTTVQLATPIDSKSVALHQLTASNNLTAIPLLNKAVHAFSVWTAGRTIAEDYAIWENKIHRSRPVLCEGDGPIMKYRRWARQFYQVASTAPDAVVQ